jgi:imidazolonepropionase-like amidohydrolase
MITMIGGRSKIPGIRLEVYGEDSARKAARSLLMYSGADFIKLGATGALSSPHTGPRHPQLTIEEMKACVEEAHKCGKKVHAHCYGEQGITNAIESGVDVIVHGQSLTDEHFSIMKSSEMVLLPTLKTFCDILKLSEDEKRDSRIVKTGIWEETRPNFEKALKYGVKIGMGTDSGMPKNLFGDNIMDLVHMVSWGMTPMQAIVAGTLNAAKSLAIDDKLGTLEKSKFADILILNNDPTKQIQYLNDSIETIMLAGNFIDPKSNI